MLGNISFNNFLSLLQNLVSDPVTRQVKIKMTFLQLRHRQEVFLNVGDLINLMLWKPSDHLFIAIGVLRGEVLHIIGTKSKNVFH